MAGARRGGARAEAHGGPQGVMLEAARSRPRGTPVRTPASGSRAAGVEPLPRSCAHEGDPRLGYRFAALNALISGFAVFVNSIGVRMFADSTLYTALKNGVVAVAVTLPFLLSRGRRSELARLTRCEWSLLLLIAVVAGSVAYGVDFRGRQISTATTAAVIGHTQFLVVAAAARMFLGGSSPRVGLPD